MLTTDLNPRTTFEDRQPVTGTVPSLLVSVRTAAEAGDAITAGADLLDAKAPESGPLGRPDEPVVSEIIRARDALAPSLPISVALGELGEWDSPRAESFAIAASGAAYLKCGLHQMDDCAGWRDRWLELRNRLDDAAAHPFAHVAVVYADWRAAQSPLPQQVIDAAIETTCAGVLFDTFGKQSGGLLTHLPVKDLYPLTDQIRAAGLLVALAGQISVDHLPELVQLPCDIIAVRTAVCESKDRTSRLCRKKVQAFRQQMAACWSSDS